MKSKLRFSGIPSCVNLGMGNASTSEISTNETEERASTTISVTDSVTFFGANFPAFSVTEDETSTTDFFAAFYMDGG